SRAGFMAVAATQMRQQLELRLLADAVVRPGHADARLVELGNQPVDRHLQDIGKLGNRYFSHSFTLARMCSLAPDAPCSAHPCPCRIRPAFVPRSSRVRRAFVRLSAAPRTSGHAPS